MLKNARVLTGNVNIAQLQAATTTMQEKEERWHELAKLQEQERLHRTQVLLFVSQCRIGIGA